MERLSQMIATPVSVSVSDTEFERMLNNETGHETGYDCHECKNRSYYWHVDGNNRWTTPCKCQIIRRNLARMRKSALGPMLDELTFERFQVREPWQQEALDTAREFYKAKDGWLYIAGQSGSGKTHLCTALVGKMMLRGDDIRYMRWVEDGQDLKFCAFGEREKLVEPLKTCQVLYIDDFLKTPDGAPPDRKDIMLAFEVLNTRYGSGLRTIISTEMYIEQVLRCDQALGSRIVQRSKGFRLEIGKADDRNWRLRDAQ